MRAPLLCLALAGCAELPPVDGAISAEARAAPPPVLVPLEGLVADATAPSRAAAAQGELEARAGRLRGAAIPAPVTGDLTARGQSLRDRAAALQAAEI